jgi:hypothetical protein
MTRKLYSPGLGKWVEVKSVEVPGALTRRRQQRREEPFAMVPLDWAAKVAEAAKAPEFAVCVQLLYLAWKAKGDAFLVSNMTFAETGVSRKVKNRVLRNLERANLIRVERHNGRSPQVTILITKSSTSDANLAR